MRFLHSDVKMPSFPRLEEHEDKVKTLDGFSIPSTSPSNSSSSSISTKEFRKYSWDEVSTHNSENDCWSVIKGKVYDVTNWIPKHPGGNLIMNGAGRDATALFISYHPLQTEAVLQKYLIGEVEDYKPYYKWESDFYTTLKKRVDEVKKQHNLNVTSKMMLLKTILLMCVWSIAYYVTISTGSYFATIILGIIHGNIGIQIGHDGNHGAYSKNPFICNLAAKAMDLMGASSITWEMQHNVGHHPNSNRKGDYYNEDYDPDSKSGYPFVRVTPNHEWKFIHKFQHIYIWVLLSVVGMKWLYGDLRSLYYRKYQVFDFWNISNGFVAYAIIMKSFFLFYVFIIPSYYYGIINGLVMFFLFTSSQSYVFILMFSVNHLTEDTIFPNDNFNERDWAKLQVMTSCNFALKSTFWHWVSGGLNFQIEHHLFPSICHMYLPYIAPVVQQTCKEFNVPYNQYPDYWSAFLSYFNHLKNLGNPATVTVVENETNKSK